MKKLSELALRPNQRRALAELRRWLYDDFGAETVVLYGSVVRGQADTESDLDLLVLTAQPFTRRARHRITDMVFEVNLRHDANFSTLAVDRRCWEEGAWSVLPLRQEILREGVSL